MENEMEENLPPALVMIVIAFVLYSFGNATRFYFTIEYSNKIVNSGLWTRCESDALVKECYNIQIYAVHDWYIMCLVMSAFGFNALIVSIACVGLRLFKFPENKVLRIITPLVVFSAVVFILIGTVLFVKNNGDIVTEPYGELSYGYSFAFCISGMCLAALVDIVLIIELIKPKRILEIVLMQIQLPISSSETRIQIGLFSKVVDLLLYQQYCSDFIENAQNCVDLTYCGGQN